MHHDIGGAMAHTLRTHLRARRLRDHFILFINDIDPLDTVARGLIHHPVTLFCSGVPCDTRLIATSLL